MNQFAFFIFLIYAFYDNVCAICTKNTKLPKIFTTIVEKIIEIC